MSPHPHKHKITEAEYEKLKKELARLEAKSKEIMKHYTENARAGDLRENDGYILSEQLLYDNQNSRAEISQILENCEIIKKQSDLDADPDIVNIGDTILLKINGKEQEVQIVGSFCADPLLDKISAESPVGKAVLGCRVGDEVVAKVKSRRISIKIASKRKSSL